MKWVLKALCLLGLLISISACRTTGEVAPPGETAQTCPNDMKSRVYAGGGCFAIELFNDEVLGPGHPLVVFIHGDSGAIKRGGWYRGSYEEQLSELKEEKLNVIAIARPGYRLPNGPTTGIYGPFNRDSYTVAVIDGLAAALKALKAHYKPSKLVLLGHSGGAMISGILLGRHPGVADGAVLVGWACDTAEWREWRNATAGRRGTWDNSLSARDYIDKVPVTTKIVALTGKDDNNTIPRFGKMCTDELITRGVPARFEMLEGLGHSAAMLAYSVTKAVLEVSN